MGAVCRVQCFPGFRKIGPAIRKCQYNGWTGTQTKCKPFCPPIRELENGIIINSCGNRFVFGCVLYFKCKEDFELNGNQVIKCLRDGKWSDTKPECQQKSTPSPNCDTLSAPEMGVWVNKVNSDECSGEPDQTCALRCKIGAKRVGPQYVYCDPITRQWSKPIPECVDQSKTN